MKDVIYEIYKSRTTPDTHNNVSDLIGLYIKKNMSVLTDGLINNYPILGETTRNRFASYYNITPEDWKIISKSPEYRLMARLADPLKLGLLYSYYETRNPIFINFLGILCYSLYMFKYFPRKFNKLIMQYTIDEFDARLDYNKLGRNLLIVIGKKTESFIQNWEKRITKTPSDKLFREMLKDFTPRYNNMINSIATAYHKNFNDPDVRIQIAYAKSADGKNNVAGAGLFEAIREIAMNSLQTPSSRILDMIGLGNNNPKNIKYRTLMIAKLGDQYINTSRLCSNILDEWMKRNSEHLTMKNFRLGFVRAMSIARHITYIFDGIDNVIYNMLADKPREETRIFNKVQMRKWIYQYLILTLYLSSGKLSVDIGALESINDLYIDTLNGFDLTEVE
jgi:hypothetical protein|uniref:Uncharacterized protein n=1 Tax=Myoviridae sp. ctkfK18 TaxID=2825165 RepID=A0A8S5VGY3_9CAUD|nr:MAG TPA: hypothetical protein [Myoviridae sp. ctkfK18]